MIEINKITMAYQRQEVIHELSLQLPEKGVTSLIGANGAGKSTLLSGIGRLQTLVSGSINIDGEDITAINKEILAKKIAILKQEPMMAMRLKVFELVLLGRYPHSKGRHSQQDYERVQKVLEQLDLMPLANKYLDELSGGQRQRAFIAMVLVQDTKYILLDEPIAALDMRYSRDMMRYLTNLARLEDKSIIIVIHDLNFALGYSDYIVGMQAGEVRYQGTVDEMATSANLSQLYQCEIKVHEVDGRKIVFPSL